jgi:hypothetical protein
MVTLLEKLARGEVVSPEASREMLETLGRQQYKDGIGRRQPYEDVASKSGALDRLRSDVGLVRSTGGRVAIAMTVDGMLRTDYSPENPGNVLIADVTGMLLEGLSAPVSELGTPEQTIELKAGMDHVQGIEVDGHRLWVIAKSAPATSRSSTSRPEGWSVPSPCTTGSASTRADSPQMENPSGCPSLNTAGRAREAADHIGCVVSANGRVYGANWDARQFYVWDRSGRLLEKRDNPAGVHYQDLKAAAGLVASGLRGNEGAIDWLDPQDFHLIRRIRAGKTSRGVAFTNEGMAISGDRLFLLPEDFPSRLFVFRLPGG